MEPNNFTFTGFIILIGGFIAAGSGALLFGQVYSCVTNCPLSATEIATRLGYSLPLLTFGSLMIITGAIFTAAGHISEQLRPIGVLEEETEEQPSKTPLRVCVKCGRQVDPSTSYCPNCGNQLSKS